MNVASEPKCINKAGVDLVNTGDASARCQLESELECELIFANRLLRATLGF